MLHFASVLVSCVEYIFWNLSQDAPAVYLRETKMVWLIIWSSDAIPFILYESFFNCVN
jgi:hypothetical protein